MRVENEPVYILHSRPYRETSLLLDLLSRHHGRLTVLARGVRGRRGRAAHLQPFRPLLASWSGRGDLPSLTASEELAAVPLPSGTTLACAFYLNELVQRCIPRGEGSEAFFAAYVQALHSLLLDRAVETALRGFEMDLLEELGFAVQTQPDGQPVRAQQDYTYLPEQGLLPGRHAGGVELNGQTLLDMGRRHFDSAQSRTQAKRLLAALLAPHLGSRPLKSRELLKAARPPAAPAHRPPGCDDDAHGGK